MNSRQAHPISRPGAPKLYELAEEEDYRLYQINCDLGQIIECIGLLGGYRAPFLEPEIILPDWAAPPEIIESIRFLEQALQEASDLIEIGRKYVIPTDAIDHVHRLHDYVCISIGIERPAKNEDPFYGLKLPNPPEVLRWLARLTQWTLETLAEKKLKPSGRGGCSSNRTSEKKSKRS